MEKTQIIGISGSMRSGKTTLAHRLRDHIPKSQIFSFADEVRREARQAFCDTPEAKAAWDEMLASDKEKLRPVLQAWGALKRKLYGADYWVKKTLKAIEQSAYDFAIIDDVRYSNEKKYVENRGVCIRLESDRYDLFERGATLEALAHESEKDLNYTHFDRHINTSELNEYDTFIEALERIKGVFDGRLE